MTGDLRVAVPPGWRETDGGGAVHLAAVGPRQPGSPLAPTLVVTVAAPTPFAEMLRATLSTLADPHVVEVADDGASGEAVVSHDVAGTGVTTVLRLLDAHRALVAGTASDREWPSTGPVIEAVVRTAGT